MFNPLPQTTIGALEQTLAFTEKRHNLLAGNIANLSTPDYRARDLDVQGFQEALAKQIQAGAPEPANPNDLQPPPIVDLEKMFSPGFHGAKPSPAAPHSPADAVAEAGPGQTRDDHTYGPRAAMEQVVYHDNSDVSLERQVLKISENRHMHALAISSLRNQFELLRTAISERV